MIKSNLQLCDTSLVECHESIMKERIKADKDDKPISFRRFTKSVANLIMTDKSIKERIINAEIDDDTKNGNGKH